MNRTIKTMSTGVIIGLMLVTCTVLCIGSITANETPVIKTDEAITYVLEISNEVEAEMAIDPWMKNDSIWN